MGTFRVKLRIKHFKTPFGARPSPQPLPPLNQWQINQARCSKCGRDLSGVLGVVCSTPHCPTGLGGVWS